MTDAGLWRLLTPRTHGGAEAGLRTQVDTTMVVAAHDPAAGWVQMVSNSHVWMVGNFPLECQQEVFAAGPDCRVPGALASQGRATRVEGGWRLDGRWQFASGVDHGDWLLLGAIADQLPESPTRALHVIVPKADIVVDDTWYTLGLRGTGSKDIVAASAFVPDHRSLPTQVLFDGLSPHGEIHATHINRLPVLVSLGVQYSGAITGIAQGALALHVERTRPAARCTPALPKPKASVHRCGVAESATELQLARSLAQARRGPLRSGGRHRSASHDRGTGRTEMARGVRRRALPAGHRADLRQRRRARHLRRQRPPGEVPGREHGLPPCSSGLRQQRPDVRACRTWPQPRHPACLTDSASTLD